MDLNTQSLHESDPDNFESAAKYVEHLTSIKTEKLDVKASKVWLYVWVDLTAKSLHEQNLENLKAP